MLLHSFIDIEDVIKQKFVLWKKERENIELRLQDEMLS